MNTKLQTLYHKSKTGATVQYTVWTEGAEVVTEYGQVSGKMQISRQTAVAKNVGRSNETTAEEQAVLQAKAKHKKKLDGKYSLTIEESKEEVFLPMLAASFEKRKDKVSYPVDVQPKLDGVRCLAYWEEDSVKLMSRGGKQWENCGHIAKELEQVLPKSWVLDGELYTHEKTFEEITKLVKKLRPESVGVEYHVYDVPRVEGEDRNTWRNRYDQLRVFNTDHSDKCPSVVVVNTHSATDEASVYELQFQFLEEGYEGAIVREYDGVYRFGHRSNKLLKVKSFMDSEYKITGFKTGAGRFEGSVIWTCVNEVGNSFNVVPQGTMEERQATYEVANNHIGDLLKVKYFELTDDGIPRFPVGLGVRLAEDM